MMQIRFVPMITYTASKFTKLTDSNVYQLSNTDKPECFILHEILVLAMKCTFSKDCLVLSGPLTFIPSLKLTSLSMAQL